VAAYNERHSVKIEKYKLSIINILEIEYPKPPPEA
jgi:hypothetical protein